MREIERRHVQYECDTCRFVSENQSDVKLCEKQHSCKHEKVIYEFIEASVENWWFNTNGIGKLCLDCNEVFDRVEFEVHSDNQDILKSIYTLVIEEVGKENNND